MQIFKVPLSQKENIFLTKNLFRCHSEWSGQSGTTEFDWADNVGDCCLEDIVTCQRDALHSVRSLCAQCQVSIILSQECKLFQSSVLTMVNSQVSCLGERDGPGARSNIDRSFAVTEPRIVRA